MTYDLRTNMTSRTYSQQRVDVVLKHRVRLHADVGPNDLAAAIQHVRRRDPPAHIVASKRRRIVDHPYCVVYAVALHKRGHRWGAARVSARRYRVDRDADDFQTLIVILVLKRYEAGNLHSARPAPCGPEVEYHYLAAKCFEALPNVLGYSGCRRYRDRFSAAAAACHHRAADNHYRNDQHQADDHWCSLTALRTVPRS